MDSDADQVAAPLASIASVSHELRAPLHAIIGLAEVLIDRDLAIGDRDLAKAIHRESKALQLIVDDLLDLSQIDAGKMEIVVQPLAPRSIADEIVSLFATSAHAKGLQLQVEIDDDVPLTVRADRYRLRQVLVNLVSNAIKYTDEGTVRIRIEPLANQSLRLMVSDTGSGIPVDALPDLFTPFLQTRANDRKKGTGLGLSIVHRLVGLMHGEIYVSSSQHGSTFSVRIPFGLARRTSDGVAAANTRSHSGRILVVDDTEVNRVVAKSQLERLGHIPTLAEDGQQALDLLNDEVFDAVLMDWHMPGLDGLATARAYYERMELAGLAPIPIVMMTASVSANARRECAEAGTADFLPKPVSLSDLDSCLRKWLISTAVMTHPGNTNDADAGSTDDNDQALPALHDGEHVDRAVIDSMVDDLGGPTAVSMVIDTFVNDTGNRRAVLFGDDRVSAQRAAHTLKSTAALLGANRLATCAAEIEQSFGDGRTPASTLLAELDDELSTAIEELTRIHAELSAGTRA